jgi:hypothetical protein
MNAKLWRRLATFAVVAVAGVLLSGPITTSHASPAAISVNCGDGGC